MRILPPHRSATALRRLEEGESPRTIVVALLANIVIGVAKLIAGLASGSSGLLAEAAHSAADSMNEVLLAVGLYRGRQPPDEAHPLGHGQERFLWAFMAHHFSGCISGFAGDLEGAIATQHNVYRVDPHYVHAEVVEADLGLWHMLNGELECAGDHLRRAVGLDPSNLRARQRQIVLAGLTGDEALAREALAALEELGGTMDEAYLKASYPFQDERHARIFRKGLAAATAAATRRAPR